MNNPIRHLSITVDELPFVLEFYEGDNLYQIRVGVNNTHIPCYMNKVVKGNLTVSTESIELSRA